MTWVLYLYLYLYVYLYVYHRTWVLSTTGHSSAVLPDLIAVLDRANFADQ